MKTRHNSRTFNNDQTDHHIPSDLFSLLFSMFLIILFWSMAESVLAAPETSQSELMDNAHISLWLHTEDDHGLHRYAALTLNTEVSLEISGPIVRAKVKQTFKNPKQSWAEGIYSFPLPENVAVDSLEMRIGEQIIKGVVQEKVQAQRRYEHAKQNGQRASLLKQQRGNVFTTAVANIAPDDVIEVVFEYQQFLDFRDGTYALRFPMVSTPSYTPVSVLNPSLSSSLSANLNSIRSEHEAPGNPVEFNIELDAGAPIFSPQSSSHGLNINKLSERRYHIEVEGNAALSNRDFLLSWQLKPSDEPLVTVLKEEAEGEQYGLLMLVPPTLHEQYPSNPRELIFVLDVSGSMEGESIIQAKAAVSKSIHQLSDHDSFNLIWFNNQARQLFQSSQPATRRFIDKALRKLDRLDANGGTEMLPAIQRALKHFDQTSPDQARSDQTHSYQKQQPPRTQTLRQVVFITDGAVTNEDQLFTEIEQHLGPSRLFTVGIGSAPNSYFMRNAARAGRGTFTYISRPDEVEGKMNQLLKQLSNPAMTDLTLDFQGNTAQVLPDPLPDLYLGEPVYAVFRGATFPDDLSLSGNLNGEASWLNIDLSKAQNGTGIAKEWARRKIDQLLEQHRRAQIETERDSLKHAVIELAKQHSQVSPFTSLVAIDVTPVRAGGELTSEQIRANRPKGWQGASQGSHQNTSGIRLAQTASGAPWHLMMGLYLLLGLCLLLGLFLLQGMPLLRGALVAFNQTSKLGRTC